MDETLTIKASPAYTIYSPLAQPGSEQQIYILKVIGSNPIRTTPFHILRLKLNSMKKIILGLLVLSSALVVSCKKSDTKVEQQNDSTTVVVDSVKVDSVK